MEPVVARELMARRYRPEPRPQPHCIEHAHLSLTDRPRRCIECRLDLELEFRAQAAQLEWLHAWRDDALDVLTRQDAALGMLQGFEVCQRRYPTGTPERHSFDVARDEEDGQREAIVEELSQTQAELLVDFLERVVETADGIVPLVNLEGGAADGSRRTDP